MQLFSRNKMLEFIFIDLNIINSMTIKHLLLRLKNNKYQKNFKSLIFRSQNITIIIKWIIYQSFAQILSYLKTIRLIENLVQTSNENAKKKTWSRFEKRLKSSKFEQLNNYSKSFEIKKIDSIIENEQILFTFIISIFVKRFNEKTLKFWIFATSDDFSYIFITSTKNNFMKLICLNENKRISKTWLRFDIDIKNDRKVLTFVNSNVSHYFIAQRIVDQLRLKLQYFFDKIRLKNDKIVDVVDFVSYK